MVTTTLLAGSGPRLLTVTAQEPGHCNAPNPENFSLSGPVTTTARSAWGLSTVKSAWAAALFPPQLAVTVCWPAVAALGTVMVAENARLVGLAVPTLIPSKARSTLLQPKLAPLTVTLAPGMAALGESVRLGLGGAANVGPTTRNAATSATERPSMPRATTARCVWATR